MEDLFFGLKERNIYDCVNVIIVSDHGEHFWQYIAASSSYVHVHVPCIYLVQLLKYVPLYAPQEWPATIQASYSALTLWVMYVTFLRSLAHVSIRIYMYIAMVQFSLARFCGDLIFSIFQKSMKWHIPAEEWIWTSMSMEVWDACTCVREECDSTCINALLSTQNFKGLYHKAEVVEDIVACKVW